MQQMPQQPLRIGRMKTKCHKATNSSHCLRLKTIIKYTCTHTYTYRSVHVCTYTCRHAHPHTRTPPAPLPGSRKRELGSFPRSPRSKPSPRSNRHRTGGHCRGPEGLPACTDTLSPEKGRGSQSRAAPAQKGTGGGVLTRQATVCAALLPADTSPRRVHLASGQACST